MIELYSSILIDRSKGMQIEGTVARRKSKGFTLIELLTVTMIVAILIIIAVPGLLSLLDTPKYARWKELHQNLKTKTSCELRLAFEKSDLDLYDAPDIAGDASGKDITGKFYNGQQLVSKDNAATIPSHGVIINDPSHIIEDSAGLPYGRFKMKGAMSLNESGTSPQAINFGPFPSIFRKNADEFSIYAWVYPTDLSTNNTLISHAGNFSMSISTSATLLITVNGTSFTSTCGNIKKNDWNFVCFQYDADTRSKIWINGKSCNTTLHTQGKLGDANSSCLVIGATYTSNAPYTITNLFKGRIGEMVGFNQYISQTDADAYFRHGSP